MTKLHRAARQRQATDFATYGARACLFALILVLLWAMLGCNAQPQNPQAWNPQGSESLQDFVNRQPEYRDPAWQAYRDCRQKCDFDGVERSNRESALHTLECHRVCKPLEAGARVTGETWAPERRPTRFPVEVTEQQIREEGERP